MVASASRHLTATACLGNLCFARYLLMSGASAGHDGVSLNGNNLTVVIGSTPTLQGRAVAGDTMTVPAEGACAVGFVEAEYAQPVAACV